MKLSIILGSLFMLIIGYGCLFSEAGYKIRGEIGNGIHTDSQTVYLYTLKEDEFVLTDSVGANQNTFFITGTTSHPVIAMLSVKESKEMPLLFVLENAELTARLDSQSTISGTPLNDNLQNYINEISPIEQRLSKLSEKVELLYKYQYPNGKQLDSIDLIFTQEENLLKRYTTDFIFENKNNVAGAYIFSQNSFLYPPAQQVSMIHNAGVAFVNDYQVKQISQFLEENQDKKERAPFLSFPMELPNGKETTIQSYLQPSKYLLIVFWNPLLAITPEIEALFTSSYFKDESQNLVIVGVALNAEASTWITCLENSHFTGIQLRSSHLQTTNLLLQYVTPTLPYMVLLSPDTDELITKGDSFAAMKFILEKGTK